MNIVLFLIAFTLLIVLPYIGVWKLFEKAGQSGWKALIPFYNYYVMLEICGRPKWWFLLLFIPVLNIFIAVGITIDFIKSYGKTKFSDTLKAVILGFIYIPKWGFDPGTKYLGQSASPEFRDKYQKFLRKSSGQEWTEAIIFAVIAATLIRGLFIEAFTIPTPSMERSLLVGDFLFVSKVNYGARTPMTPVSFPFAHHTMPIFDVKSYWDGIKLPYYRLPGLSHVKKGDVVVFNYPMDADSPLYRPVDKRENYIKRCQGTPGDTLKLINTQVYINNKAAITPPESQTSYLVRTNGQELNPQVLYDLHIDPSHGQVNNTDLEWIMPRESVPTLKSYSNITYIAPYIQPAGQADLQVFPHNTRLKWNVDNYGPIIIPKKGWTVKLDSTNFMIYERAIKLYENNKLEKRGNDIYINGTKTNQYTFKMDYYWMMGDNRHNSLDSRFWGFVPEDHIVGKALFVWMSWDENASFMHKIRWERLFMGIR